MYHIRVQRLFQFRVWFVHLYMYICICRLLYICWPFSYICFYFIHRSFTPFRYSAFWTKYTIAPATATAQIRKKIICFFSLSRMWLKTEKKHVKVTLAQIYNVTKATINTNTRFHMNSMRLCLAHLCSFWLKIDVSHCAHCGSYISVYFNSVDSNLVYAWLNIVSKHENIY